VTQADVAVVALEHRPTWAAPGKAIRQPEDGEVVNVKNERRVDPLPRFDIDGILHVWKPRIAR
jgi:hypothetical protein